jgi:hypothetical protein
MRNSTQAGYTEALATASYLIRMFAGDRMNVPHTEVLKRRFALVCLGLLVAAFASPLNGQSIITAGRPAEIAVTGGYLYGSPKYGPDKMQGLSFGAMYTRYFHLPVAPSLEVRANIGSTSYIKETTYLGGLRVQGQVLRKLHPYGDLLIGGGTINFKFPASSNYTSDNSLVYNYGGGVGVDVINNVQLTGDFQYQSWNLGSEHGGYNYKFNPTLLTLGVKYTIPFKSYVGSSHHYKEK